MKRILRSLTAIATLSLTSQPARASNEPTGAAEALQALMPEARFANGFLHGIEGAKRMDQVSRTPSAP